MIVQLVGSVVLGLLVLAIVIAGSRLRRGRSAGDRAVAADLVFFGFVGVVAVLGLMLGVSAVFDLILVATLLGFLSALSLARLLQRGRR